MTRLDRLRGSVRLIFVRSVPLATAVLALAVASPTLAQEGTPSKVSSIVEQAVMSSNFGRAMTASVAEESDGILRFSKDGLVELVFHAMVPTGRDEEASLEALGARIVNRYVPSPLLPLPEFGQIQAWLPLDSVAAAAELDWVVAITPPSYPEVNTHPTNPTNSEGVALHNSDLAQAQGVTGAGVTVGAISDGVSNLAASQAANELPAVNVILVGSGDEGTAMLEIIHDMAPGSALAFHATGSGTTGHVTAVTNLVAANVDVIAEDLAYDGEPAFQQGVVAAAREGAANLGIPVHSSSGNRGTNHTARVAAVGTGGGPDGINFGVTPPGCSNNPDNVVAIGPGGDTTFDVTLGLAGSGSTRITLQWSEPRAIAPTPGRGGFTDLNLYVMDAGLTQCLAQSVAVQASGQGDTIEVISIDSPGTAAKIIVDVQGTSSAVAAPILDLRWRGMQAETDATTRASSNDPDKNYTGLAYAIGAVSAVNGALTGFSSAGPVNLLQTTICPGGGVGPCAGVAGGAGQNFQGLDFLGASGVSISGVGGFGGGTCPAVNPGDCTFSGTSASAPHTAACDALVRELLGAGAAPATTRARLAATAMDPDGPGENSTTGAGTVDCFAAIGPPDAVCSNRLVPTDAGVCVATGISVDAGSSDPFGQAISLDQNPDNPYALGATPVDLTATDTDGLTDVCTSTVTVVDQEKPSITAPADITKECDSHNGTAVDIGIAIASDNCDADPSVSNDAPALFPLGVTPVTWTATDDALNQQTDGQLVTIEDTTPPEITVSVSPDKLWPPNHKLVPITPTVVATDICDPNPIVRLISISSNEADNGNGDGNTTGDIAVTDDFTYSLRAERVGSGTGRIYTIVYEAEDQSGNKTQAEATVVVPKSMGQ
jgi:hypothetical protein